MKASLNYSLPDDEYDFHAALAGKEALRALWDIDHRCRDVLKHGDPGDEAEHLLREIRAMIPAKILEIGNE